MSLSETLHATEEVKIIKTQEPVQIVPDKIDYPVYNKETIYNPYEEIKDTNQFKPLDTNPIPDTLSDNTEAAIDKVIEDGDDIYNDDYVEKETKKLIDQMNTPPDNFLAFFIGQNLQLLNIESIISKYDMNKQQYDFIHITYNDGKKVNFQQVKIDDLKDYVF